MTARAGLRPEAAGSPVFFGFLQSSGSRIIRQLDARKASQDVVDDAYSNAVRTVSAQAR
jgi:hypothetical protein